MFQSVWLKKMEDAMDEFIHTLNIQLVPII